MPFTSITAQEIALYPGVTGLADRPTGTPDELKAAFDQLPRELLIPAVNRLVAELTASAAAGCVGAVAADGSAATVQQCLAERALAADTYTRDETEAAIGQRVTEIGAGDMTQLLYDPQRRRTDMFAYADAAAAAYAPLKAYAVSLPAAGWRQNDAGFYYQTAPAAGMTAAFIAAAPVAVLTGEPVQDAALNRAAALLDYAESAADGITFTCCREAPQLDLQLLVPGVAAWQ